ncbi:PIN domain-containing protein [Phytobacter ursingii]|uniref:Uncharacterized protein n=1 Tax=Phytobacter ursingii TaxID=1972431 RepID=A0AB35RZG1_9ENTR|nr:MULTISPECIES: hypothetical protein [Enterobacteriaceae]MDV2865577.1 hypothetical protein [Phytobacter ursingii]
MGRPDAIILATVQTQRRERAMRNTFEFTGVPGVNAPWQRRPGAFTIWRR